MDELNFVPSENEEEKENTTEEVVEEKTENEIPLDEGKENVVEVEENKTEPANNQTVYQTQSSFPNNFNQAPVNNPYYSAPNNQFTRPQNFDPYTGQPNPNVQYNPYRQQQYSQNPYGYAPKPKIVYDPATNQYVIKEKKPVKTSTIVYISIIVVLFVAFSIALFVALSTNSKDKGNDIIIRDPDHSQSETQNSDETINPYNFFSFDSKSNDNYESHDVDINLVEDKGDTQKTSNDLKDNSEEPNKNFADLKSKSEPIDEKTGDYTSETAYNKVAPAVVAVQCYKDKITDEKSDVIGEGTGTVISKDGYIVTNSHVIGNSKAYRIQIVFNDKTKKVAKVVGYDSRTDIAVLKVDANDLECVTFGDSETLKVGEDIIAIGNPGGASFQNSLTKGIISFVGREISINDLVKYIQIDASINPGNSGGPLCNIYGQVIGINTAKISSTEYEGMGFAIPTSTVLKITNDLIHYGYVQGRVRVGISGEEISAAQAETYGLPEGILIEEIAEDGPMAGVDIQKGDIITEVDGTKVTTFQNVYAILEQHKPGDKVKITVMRERNN